MNPDQFGPFTNIIAIALALVAAFSVLLAEALGPIKRWTRLIGEPPALVVTAGARILTIALMVAAYLMIDESNYGWFVGLAVLLGVMCFAAIAYFDHQRRTHVISVPQVGNDGKQLAKRSKPLSDNKVIGSLDNMLPKASADFEAARAQGGLSLRTWLAGYGQREVNNPENVWEIPVLARVGNRLTITLMSIILFAVFALFLAALAIDVAPAG